LKPCVVQFGQAAVHRGGDVVGQGAASRVSGPSRGRAVGFHDCILVETGDGYAGREIDTVRSAAHRENTSTATVVSVSVGLRTDIIQINAGDGRSARYGDIGGENGASRSCVADAVHASAQTNPA